MAGASATTGTLPRRRADFGGVRGRRLSRPPGATLAAAVWQLEPGATQAPYHFHHGAEELLIVLRGRPTLRAPGGERRLEEGEVVHFARGPEGAHQLVNRSPDVARYLIASAQTTPEIVEYPDSGKVAVMARTESQGGGPLFQVHRLADAVDCFDGEPRLASPATMPAGGRPPLHFRVQARQSRTGLPVRGKSGHHRAGCWLTASGGNPRESATETTQPRVNPRQR